MQPGLLKLCALTTMTALLSIASLPAQAIGRLADVTIVDRETGATLPVHYAKGQYWVAGRPGARYAVSVRNRIGERVLAVTSVDGVNVLSGETAAWDQDGYVFSGYERHQIKGWRKSNREVAAFEFSNAANSYAGRTGRPNDVGVIGVALFREKQALQSPPQPDRTAQRGDKAKSSLPSIEAQESESIVPDRPSTEAAAPMPAPAPRANAQTSDTPSGDGSANSSKLSKTAPDEVAPRTPKLGTAHGQRETSVTKVVTFERLRNAPHEVISIRYDTHDNLVAAGVIGEPARAQVPSAFPQSGAPSYVPDPPSN